MFTERKAGILLHPTSLPNHYGIGDLGTSAYKFVDFLTQAKQSFWQLLPLTATTCSPYKGFSAFANNYMLISPEKLYEIGLITNKNLNHFIVSDNSHVNFNNIFSHKINLLTRAFKTFRKKHDLQLQTNFENFCHEKADWLEDYALFMSLKYFFIKNRNHSKRKHETSEELQKFIELTSSHLNSKTATEYYYNAVWSSWDKKLIEHDSDTIKYYKDLLHDEIEFHKFCEFIFHIQWYELKSYANINGIKLIGDIPIFVSYDSVDVWMNQHLFYLDNDGYPTVVSGAPPDYFSEDGQLWGDPIYNWEYHKQTNFAWWTSRIKNTLILVDAMRIDHFRGFEAYWETKYGEKTAKSGHWVKGPDKEFFHHIEQELGHLPLIAEDLGIITKDVEFLRDFFDIPGICVLQFAFDGSEDNPYIPENIERNKVVYTGTHDNNTTVGWYNELDDNTKDIIEKYIHIDESNVAYSLIEIAYSTLANTVIIPLQDVLELDASHRMNTPSTIVGNWEWRFRADMLKDEYADRLGALVLKYKRS
ncbi:MAG TPA: 4-alpha-glucanotransferase [Clostridiales bacterium]|nr:4-alpha-glucanotransferase [Clostridiales bacterium]